MFNGLLRRLEVAMTRLRLGKCCLYHYLHEINRHDAGLCDTCGVPETIEHHLLSVKMIPVYQ